ncbi:kynureninase [soil metagenome]
MITLADCRALDAVDPLAQFRSRFALPAGTVYLDGNSLGALPAATPARMQDLIVNQWGQDLIGSWNRHGWIDLPQRLGDKIGHLLGAAPGQLVVGDSTSINVFKVLSAALQLRRGRTRIVSERGNFPTDLYIAQGLSELLARGHRLELIDIDPLDIGSLDAVLDGDTAVVLLTQVDYRSGRLLDMARITARVQAAGAMMIWDLAHSAGALPVELDAAGADFAVGCGYKYLNGGPGAPAFVYAARRHHATMQPALAGWFGHADPFAFDRAYRPAAGIDRLLVGTPPLLSLAALEVGVDLMSEANAQALRAKSLSLKGLFIALVDQRLAEWQLRLDTPREADARGSQVSLGHAECWAIMQALIAEHGIGDFRAPDVLRFGFAPLYNSHHDVWLAVDRLHGILATRRWDSPAFRERARVT